MIQAKKLIGSITANITAYVGLQLENTGQSENHTNTLHNTHFLFDDFCNHIFDLSDNQSLVVIFFHRFGKIVIIQNIIKIIQLKSFHTIGSTHINKVDAFNNNENIIIEILSDIIIIYGLDLLSNSCILLQRIIGKSGKTHGASIVKIPAKKEIISKSIIVF